MNRVCWLKNNKIFVEIIYQETINNVNGALGARVRIAYTLYTNYTNFMLKNFNTIWLKIMLPQLQFTPRVYCKNIYYEHFV